MFLVYGALADVFWLYRRLPSGENLPGRINGDDRARPVARHCRAIGRALQRRRVWPEGW